MSRIIKNFDSFADDNTNEAFDLSGVMDFLGGAVGFAGEGLRKSIKEKIAEIIMEKIGILPDTILSGLVQEVVDQVPIKDYPAIMTGEKANVEYLAPMLSKAVIELVERKGLDTMAKQIGIDPNGMIFRTIRNGVQSEKGRAVIEKIIIDLFGGENATGSVARDAIVGLEQKDKNELADTIRNKASQFYGKSMPNTNTGSETGGMGDYLTKFMDSLSGTKQTA